MLENNALLLWLVVPTRKSNIGILKCKKKNHLDSHLISWLIWIPKSDNYWAYRPNPKDIEIALENIKTTKSKKKKEKKEREREEKTSKPIKGRTSIPTFKDLSFLLKKRVSFAFLQRNVIPTFFLGFFSFTFFLLA